MTEEEARQLTDEIKDNINQSARLIQRAHEGQIWLTLGYTSFQEWLKEAVGVSRARGYQLLNIAKTEDELREAMPLPATFILSDRETRIIKKTGVEKIVEATKAITEEDRELIDVGKFDEEVSNYQSLIEAINREEAEQKERTPAPEDNVLTYYDEPVEPNVQAKNYFTQFLYQLDDLPPIDEVEPSHYAQIIEELEASVQKIDELLGEYLEGTK